MIITGNCGGLHKVKQQLGGVLLSNGTGGSCSGSLLCSSYDLVARNGLQ